MNEKNFILPIVFFGGCVVSQGINNLTNNFPSRVVRLGYQKWIQDPVYVLNIHYCESENSVNGIKDVSIVSKRQVGNQTLSSLVWEPDLRLTTSDYNGIPTLYGNQQFPIDIDGEMTIQFFRSNYCN